MRATGIARGRGGFGLFGGGARVRGIVGANGPFDPFRRVGNRSGGATQQTES